MKGKDIVLNHPREAEKVGGPSFALCVEAPEAVEVEVRIDDGEWLRCRLEGDCWRCEWTACSGGPHVASARMISRDGRLAVSQRNRFIVDQR